MFENNKNKFIKKVSTDTRTRAHIGRRGWEAGANIRRNNDKKRNVSVCTMYGTCFISRELLYSNINAEQSDRKKNGQKNYDRPTTTAATRKKIAIRLIMYVFGSLLSLLLALKTAGTM